MKSCIVVPRILIPYQTTPTWAMPASFRWKSAELEIGEATSTYHMLLPEEEESAEEREERIEHARGYMYYALEEVLEKLNRGIMLVEHTDGLGLWHGIVAALDLEGYTMSEKETSRARPSQQFDRKRAEALAQLRERSVLEFPAATFFYRDKKNKILRALDDDLEEVYSFHFGHNQHVRGLFVPEDAAWEVADDMHTRGEPCFAVAAGEEEVAAAKLHWERVKKTLGPGEEEMHPARYMLAEFVNAYEIGVNLHPAGRVLAADPAEVYAELSRKFKCSVDGPMIRVAARDIPACIRETDAILTEFAERHGKKLRYADTYSKGETMVLPPVPAAEDIFSYLKGGKLLPAHSFVLDGCYHFEGKEVSYD